MTDAFERGIAPLREDVAKRSSAVKDLAQMVTNLHMIFELLARGHERVATRVLLLRVETAKGFQDMMANIKAGWTQAVGRAVGSGDDVVQTFIAEITSLVRANLYERTARAVRTAEVCVDINRSWL